MSNFYRYRKADTPKLTVDGVEIQRWDWAKTEEEMHSRMVPDTMYEIHAPAKPWYVRLWRKFFPLKFIEATKPV